MAAESRFNQIHEKYRASFLDDLPSRIKEADAIIARAQLTARWSHFPAELFTHIHGIKGSATTFGFHIVAMVCHQMEEYIKQFANAATAPENFADIVTGYLRACDEALQEIRENSEAYTRTEQRLTKLRTTAFGQKFSVALVFNSPSLMAICQDIASTCHARVSAYTDSLSGLHGFLSNPCDVLFVSSESYPLTGEALIAAIKMSPRIYKSRTVLISSTPDKALLTQRQYDPDHVVIRDASFADNLQRVFTRLRVSNGSGNG